jgi:hypothetical protein
MDITFNIEMAGFKDIASDLFEALVCLENGAYRAGGMMSVAAMQKALEAAKATQGQTLKVQLEWAKESGRMGPQDLRCALVNLWPGRTGDWEQASSEGAVETAVRLAKKVLFREIERGLLEAAGQFGKMWHPAKPGGPANSPSGAEE